MTKQHVQINFNHVWGPSGMKMVEVMDREVTSKEGIEFPQQKYIVMMKKQVDLFFDFLHLSQENRAFRRNFSKIVKVSGQVQEWLSMQSSTCPVLAVWKC